MSSVRFIPVIEADLGRADPDTGVARLFRVNRVSREELKRAIDVHLEPLAEHGQMITDSCPLFGGAICVVDEEAKLRPQCCGDLSDLNSWFALAKNGFSEGWICAEGHPIPHVTRKGDEFVVVCRDDWEDFSAETVPEFAMRRDDCIMALVDLWHEVTRFCAQVDTLSADYGVRGLSRILVGLEREAEPRIAPDTA